MDDGTPLSVLMELKKRRLVEQQDLGVIILERQMICKVTCPYNIQARYPLQIGSGKRLR